MARTLGYIRIKSGFEADREFTKLRWACESAETYYAAVGLWLSLVDETHRADRPIPTSEPVQLVQLLQLAGLLDEAGSIPQGSFEKYRMEDRLGDRQVAAGKARAASAARTERGTFAATPATTSLPAKRSGAENVLKNEERRDVETSGRTVEPIADVLKSAPWNKRKPA